MTDLRPCSICLSYSQAELSHYALNLFVYKFITTFVRLRYLLGGHRPSETAYHTMSCIQLVVLI
jgi:hypothetical protein